MLLKIKKRSELMSAKNHNLGKHRPSLVLKDMNNAFHELVKVREGGSIKYDRLNFLESKGTDDAARFLEENADSIARHVMAWLSGETLDPESGCHHMAHVMCRAGFVVEYEHDNSASVKTESIYPWHLAPDWARFAAKDRDGFWHWYEVEPRATCDSWTSARGSMQFFDFALDIDWDKSLEARP